MRTPVVGLTCYRQEAAWGAWKRPAALLPAAYVDAVAAAGGRPILIPPCESIAGGSGDRRVIAAIDALVLVGGEDIGENPMRDAGESALLAAALEVDLPVLGICRGHQLLNLHLGGTLHSHLPDLLGHEHHRPAPGKFGRMTMDAEAGSLVAAVMGKRFTVACSHHQAIDTLGKGLIATARSTDGVIEAVEREGSKFVVGAQWHPEEEGDTRLFAALIAAVEKGAALIAAVEKGAALIAAVNGEKQ